MTNIHLKQSKESQIHTDTCTHIYTCTHLRIRAIIGLGSALVFFLFFFQVIIKFFDKIIYLCYLLAPPGDLSTVSTRSILSTLYASCLLSICIQIRKKFASLRIRRIAQRSACLFLSQSCVRAIIIMTKTIAGLIMVIIVRRYIEGG